MELALIIIILFGGMIGIVFIYQYLTEKLGLGTQQKQPQPQLHIPQGNPYENFRMDYENFAVGVFNCLTAIGEKYGLRRVNDPRGVHSARIADRVRIFANERIIFVYEFHREPDYSSPLSKNCYNRKIDAAIIAAVFEEDLQSYLVDGYFFDGHVVGFDVDDKTVRIEVYGVNRYIPNGGSYETILY